MIERAKTWILVALVAASLVQSYMLAYSMPGFGTTVRTDQGYVNTEQMGAEQKVEDVIFPEQLLLHFGNGKHTVLNVGELPAYWTIFNKLKSREFAMFQKISGDEINWKGTAEGNIGLELRFGGAIPVGLLSKVMKLSGDSVFRKDSIDRIWIFQDDGSANVIRTFFFSSDGNSVYESTRADLTSQDIKDYLSLAAYGIPYIPVENGVYVPQEPLESGEVTTGYNVFSPDAMQRNLFFDPAKTRTLKDRNGSQVYTDGKVGLQVDQEGRWIRYSDPAALQNNDNDNSSLNDSVPAAVQFINQHGGWDGIHRLQNAASTESVNGNTLMFGQYVRLNANHTYPIISTNAFHFGYMKLTIQQGVVTEYERSLISLLGSPDAQTTRWLPGDQELMQALEGYSRRAEVQALIPAVEATPLKDDQIRFDPVWMVRLTDGTRELLTEALPADFDGSAYRNKRSSLLEEDSQPLEDNTSAASEAGGETEGSDSAKP